MRERRPGVWEIRVAAGTDPVTGRTVQRSVTFHGTAADAETYRAEFAAEYAARRSVARAAPLLTVAELLGRWMLADRPWKPSTRVGYASNVRFLTADPIASTRVASLTPGTVRAGFARWEHDGASISVIGGRFRVLRSAIGWAYDERIIDYHPIRNMRGPGRPRPRRPLADEDVVALLRTAEAALIEALANDTDTARARQRRRGAEQDLLMVRLAADTGARRGELAGLQFADLDGRVLHIQRAASGKEITTPKSGHGRTLTLGASTARLWHTLAIDWQRRNTAGGFGPWLFSADPDHQRRIDVGVLGHRFSRLRTVAEVHDATLHRLRHNVATFLVSRGEILQAQARLGHADAATTLREYVYALPRTDTDVADALDDYLNQVHDTVERDTSRPS